MEVRAASVLDAGCQGFLIIIKIGVAITVLL